jgi:NADPH2:quinone reductase
MVIGWDAAGTIEAVGAGVANWRIGDRVAAMTVQPGDQNGAYTEHVNLAADLVLQQHLGLVSADPVVAVAGALLVAASPG